MKATRHLTNNAELGAPEGMSPDECQPLPITRIVYDLAGGGGLPACVSYWTPSPEQLALLNAGRPVWLSVLGTTHPPLCLGVEGDGRLG